MSLKEEVRLQYKANLKEEVGLRYKANLKEEVGLQYKVNLKEEVGLQYKSDPERRSRAYFAQKGIGYFKICVDIRIRKSEEYDGIEPESCTDSY